MSMLDKLSIRGIRNFGVDATDEQKIAFMTPLTLVLGPNGCGKTTLIESIKYALTGELPPNCKDGQSFINNPDVLHLPDSMGEVKLRIKNLRGTTNTVCRSAKVQKKGKKSQFKSLDSTVTVEENGKQPITVSKRNNDATVDMCDAMGVSKAIINDVLFCHQEEANWPLSTDQELMSKFDKIFGTTEYNNAIEKIRKMRKQYEIEIKNKSVTLKELEMNKQATDAKNHEISMQTEEMEILQQAYDNCLAQMEPLKQSRNEFLRIEQELSKIIAERTKKETELKNERENQEKLLKKITNLFAGDESELQTQITLFKAKHATKESELNDSKRNLEKGKREQAEIGDQIDESNRKCSSLMQQRESEQDSYAKRAEYMREICALLKINLDFDVENCNEQAEEVLLKVRDAMDEEDERVTEIHLANEQIGYEQQAEVNKLRENEVRIDSEISSVRKQLTDLEKEQVKLKENLLLVEGSAQKLKAISLRIVKVNKTFEEFCASEDLNELRAKITTNREKRTEMDEELETIDDQIAILSLASSILAEIAGKEKQVEKRDSEIRRIKNKHSNNLHRLFPDETIESDFKKANDAIILRLRIEVNKIEAESRRSDRVAQELSFNHKSKKQELTRLENEQRDLEDKIYEQCQSTPFIEVLEAAKEKVADLQLKRSSLKSSEAFYKNYIQKMEQQPCCPLCHKDLNGNEVGDLTSELSNEIELLPQNIFQAEQLLREENNKLETLLATQPMVKRLELLRSNLIPKVKTELTEIDGKLSAAKAKKQQSDLAIEEPKEKMKLANSISGDMSLLDEAIRDVERNRRELDPLRASLPDNTNGMSLEELQRKRKEKYDEAKELNAVTEMLSKREQRYTEQIRKFQDVEIELKTEEIKLQTSVQNLSNLQAREKDITFQINEFRNKKKQLEDSLIPVRMELDRAMKTKEETKRANAATLKTAQSHMDKLKKLNNDIDRISQVLRDWAGMRLESEIKRYGEILARLREDQQKKAHEIESIQQKIIQLTKDIADQAGIERNLQDNLELMKIQVNIDKHQKELSGLQKNEGDIDFEKMSIEKDKVLRELNKLSHDSSRIDGQKREKSDTIERIGKELKNSKYKNSVQNYCKAFYEHVVLKKIVIDLTTYCETLERALTKFHSEKMAKINRLIRELWRSIYKGNDIDYIQINTEEVQTTTKKRTYTYRVVASKNDSFMDFRGQSSAGQRVLACLIIRIALAETFSGSCGVLALDEPTTNLDKSNIRSLCEALNRLVDEREGQRNFMLIIITHDEEFITELARVMSYYYVSRENSSGKSIIQKLRVA